MIQEGTDHFTHHFINPPVPSSFSSLDHGLVSLKLILLAETREDIQKKSLDSNSQVEFKVTANPNEFSIFYLVRLDIPSYNAAF